jgi:hypothetical protein
VRRDENLNEVTAADVAALSTPSLVVAASGRR